MLDINLITYPILDHEREKDPEKGRRRKNIEVGAGTESGQDPRTAKAASGHAAGPRTGKSRGVDPVIGKSQESRGQKIVLPLVVQGKNALNILVT